MASERTMYLVWRPGIDRTTCFKSELSCEDAWVSLRTALQSEMAQADAIGWRCSKITAEDKDDE